MYKGTPVNGAGCGMAMQRTGRMCSGRATREIGIMKMCESHAERMMNGIEAQVKIDSAMRAWLHSVLGVSMKVPASTANAGRELQNGLAALGGRVQVSKSVVYFMYREDMVKIGVTKNVTKRVNEVSRGSAMPKGMTVGPVQLLGTIPGAYDEEKALHRRFWRERVGGEWFRYTPQIASHIEQLISEHQR
jgi:hypothetical protein